VETLDELLRIMMGKMTGRQAATVIISVAALLGGQWAYSAWLENKRLT
jgi:hypothetical protein